MNNQRRELYDGLQDDFYDKNYEIIYGDKTFHFNVLSFTRLLEKLHEEITEAVLAEIIETLHFTIDKQPFIFEKCYSSKEGLRIYYLKIKDVILFVSMGESQPGRYRLYYEGVWDLGSGG